MTDQRTIDRLEHDLRGPDTPAAGGPDLATIRWHGTRRRRVRGLVAGGGSVAAAAVLGVLLATTLGGRDRAVDQPGIADRTGAQRDAHPQELSPLARRALAEIPGAVQVSARQVVLPTPDDAPELAMKLGGRDRLDAEVDLGSPTYAGVTAYPGSAFPTWLYDGVEEIERSMGDGGGYPVGSTDMGILVESGSAELACVGRGAHDGCSPSLVSEVDGDRYYQWGMGTEDFLEPGSKMEVFLADDYSTGSPGSLAFAGLAGTDVARVTLVNTAGESVEGTVESGTVVPDQTMMWGHVRGTLAKVVAYDAAGEVIEDHQLKSCDGGVDCEVR